MFLGQARIKTFCVLLSDEALYVANILLTLLTYECLEGKKSGPRSGEV